MNVVYNDESEVQKAIETAVKTQPVLLFIKGTAQMPMCGFSKGVIDMFSYLEVPFETVDVLADPLIREGVKKFTQWPTIPQIFLKGQFIGGFDICRELFERGELETMVKQATTPQ
jgi:monothiol glutaredoxin